MFEWIDVQDATAQNRNGSPTGLECGSMGDAVDTSCEARDNSNTRQRQSSR